ncbi:Glutamine--fructose-6-phosphate aminotransferase [isomerizing] [hydrothermal vent metagenome]|uniref:Glutamine--fructose-6-phosphate aminotransferase [isomerizing] n=1 Tax=hydrothermal vent metagenome TaxID=652676 RepID=A0A3B0SRV2_9ZZZZ
MCGIVGIVGSDPVTDRLVEGLKRLEYRGYDSAGVAVLNGVGVIRRRAKGRIVNLEQTIAEQPADGFLGIAHTRWATHGKPTVINAHPHTADQVAIVHNGIIENFKELRQELEKNQRTFSSQTDSEVIVQMIARNISLGMSEDEAFFTTIDRLEGAYAIAAIFETRPSEIFAARQNVPLVVGLGETEGYVGSDAFALAPFTRQVIFLKDGDRAIVRPNGVSIFDANQQPVERPVVTANAETLLADKGDYDHFMQKEIQEQPESIARTLAHYGDALSAELFVSTAEDDFANSDRLVTIACGTAFLAGSVAKYWFEALAGLHMEVEIASEFRYRQPALPQKGPVMFVSQSGETADTLACLKYAKSFELPTYAVVNVAESSIARDAKGILPTLAGPEIGVASTKAFTAQLAALACSSLSAARARGKLDQAQIKTHMTDLLQAPTLVKQAFALEDQLQKIAHDLKDAKLILFMGRGINYPLAMEGALKMKEITYIQSEGYAAGELKHGPIALIEEGTHVVVIAPWDILMEKTLSNVEEVISRGARVVLLTDEKGAAQCHSEVADIVIMPTAGPMASALVSSIPLQLLAYHTAVAKGTDVDKPRNLAKSVTVE